MDERLKRLLERRTKAAEARAQKFESRKAIVDLAEQEAREDLSDEEDAEFRKLTDELKSMDADLAGVDERIAELSEEARREQSLTVGAAAVKRAQAQVQVTEGRTYQKGSQRSYFRDIAAVQIQGRDAEGAQERLRRHAVDVQTAPEYRTGDTTTDGAGGYFVPPAWLISQYIPLNRAGRATADLATHADLPGGTDSFNIPKIATGTTVAQMGTAQNSATVSETSLTDSVVTVNVQTVAGQQTVSQQLMDQSPINFDEVVFQDLIADYNRQVGSQVINGQGSSGDVKGILAATGIIAVTYTDTAPVVKGLYSKLNDAIQQIYTSRYDSASVIVMHPRRWAWIQNSFDTSGRPLSVPSGPGQNAIATFGSVGSQKVVGEMLGLPVVTDPQIPTNLGAGTNQDDVLVMKADDAMLWESSLRTRVFPEVLSSTLSVRLQVYGYIAYTAERNPKGIAVISGTGLTPPVFT